MWLLRGGADKFLAWPTSRCCRTESWKTAGFWLNLQLSNRASHVSRLGPSFTKIWTCEGHQVGSCSCTTMTWLAGRLQTRWNWPSSVLITHPVLWICPWRTTTCFLDWKNNCKVAIFRPTRRSLLPRRPAGRTHSEFLLSGFQKLEEPAKKRIELRGYYIE
jgi:hypothetical protein